MRLINTETFQLGDFSGVDSAPPFAILSHTWGEQECSLSDMQDPKVALRAGYAKIDCCTDKTSSAELSEAINSMFEWYAQSSVCYVYLSDISLPKDSPDMLTAEDLGRSRWVSRGWTLQELIAPDYVRFFSDDWTECGNRRALATIIHRVTNIAPEILDRPPEDRAYCLLGLFRVNMAMLYGEGGPRAFYRLQEEIMKSSTDQSILAWTPIQPEPSATTSNQAQKRNGSFGTNFKGGINLA
ncbi:hypothetical protein B0T24DRAFT_649346 [Lasiosphaeria ovina]|uniref:DUF8212 domain-containing protein n=1 Tax=Lasiosphaeria ovina TaxID=92902 RepID=A0AAE0KBY7_9PEZI|nr:hypothetical protein B0T24DRAFT_649346 [Lasiosphaeria ovina]